MPITLRYPCARIPLAKRCGNLLQTAGQDARRGQVGRARMAPYAAASRAVTP